MTHTDILHLIDDLMPEEVREKMRTRTRERKSIWRNAGEELFAWEAKLDTLAVKDIPCSPP